MAPGVLSWWGRRSVSAPFPATFSSMPVFSSFASFYHLIRTLAIEFRAHLGNPGYPPLEILNYICKDLSPNVCVPGFWMLGYGHNWGGGRGGVTSQHLKAGEGEGQPQSQHLLTQRTTVSMYEFLPAFAFALYFRF